MYGNIFLSRLKPRGLKQNVPSNRKGQKIGVEKLISTPIIIMISKMEMLDTKEMREGYQEQPKQPFLQYYLKI